MIQIYTEIPQNISAMFPIQSIKFKKKWKLSQLIFICYQTRLRIKIVFWTECDLEIVYVKHKGALSISVYTQTVRSSSNCISVVFVDASKLQVCTSMILAIGGIWTASGITKIVESLKILILGNLWIILLPLGEYIIQL